MTEVILDIKKWGNSLGVRLPAVIAREAHLHSDQRVRISIVDKQIIITPIVSEALTLGERLANFDPVFMGVKLCLYLNTWARRSGNKNRSMVAISSRYYLD